MQSKLPQRTIHLSEIENYHDYISYISIYINNKLLQLNQRQMI